MQNNSVLKKIVKYKIDWVNINKKIMPLEKFHYKIQKSNKEFYNKLKYKNKFFILECKKSSPSSGIIRNNFNLKEIIKVYEQYATIISVLTDEKYFCGNFNFLLKTSKLTNLPILCKDFIIDEWQIYLARFYQADAILLMLSILNNDDYYRFAKIAHYLNMGVVTEIINKEELYRAINLKAKVIDINNRNLHDLSIDFNRTKKLSLLLPKNVKIISASGINNHNQIRKLSKYVDGFLIGSSLMLEKNLNIGIRKILFGENKVCGLSNLKDAQASFNAGAIYGGLIFIPKSLRYIDINKCINIIEKSNLQFVGVFYNAEINKVVSIVKYLNLDIVQLHGQENISYINKLKELIPDTCLIWKVFDMNIYQPNYNISEKLVSRIVLDNGGGTGKTFNWSLINKKFLKKIILSGGLSIFNCVEAIKLGCSGLDFNSKIEISPGIKDHKKLFKLFGKICTY